MKKVIEPFNIHLDAFWERDLKTVARMIRKLDAETIKKLYGMTIIITDKPFFPHPKTGEPMVGDTRYFRGKPYLIILGAKPTCRILYHEVAHAIGIDDETEAMDFARKKESELCTELPVLSDTTIKDEFLPMELEEGPPLPRGLDIRWPWRKP